MTKLQFLLSLSDRLSGLPKNVVEEHLNFYSEIIEDRVEEGLSEEEAVLAVGSVEEIAAQIANNIPADKLPKKQRRFKAWEIVLLAVGSPIWLSLLVSAFAVFISLYVSLWAVIISLWAVFVSLGAYSFSGIAAGIYLACTGSGTSGLFMMAAGFLCGGLAIFLFYGCKAATKGTSVLTKKIFCIIKNRFLKKEVLQ